MVFLIWQCLKVVENKFLLILRFEMFFNEGEYFMFYFELYGVFFLKVLRFELKVKLIRR